MTPRSQGSDLIKLADFRPVAADPARYLNHIGQIASKRLQDIPRAVAEFSINGRPVTVPEHLPLPQSVSTGLCRASDLPLRPRLQMSYLVCMGMHCYVPKHLCESFADVSCSMPGHVKLYNKPAILHESICPELVKLSCLAKV